MLWFVLRKLAVFIATVLVSAVLTYGLLSAAPGALPDANGMLVWLGRALVGDFGLAADGSAAGTKIAARLAVTIPLSLLAMIVAVVAGSGVGYLAAMRAGSPSDKMLVAFAELSSATPSFWLGMALSLLFAGIARWLPPGGFVPWQDNVGAALLSLVLPALALALPTAGTLARRTRNALIAARGSGYLLGAQARGRTVHQAMLSEGMPEAALRVAAGLGSAAVTIVAGTMIVETVFYLPGLGRLILDALNSHDLVLVRGGLVVLVLLLAGAAFLSAIGAGWADPRLRAGRSE